LLPNADDRRRIHSGTLQHQRNHRRRCRLAVRAGDGDAVPEPHQLGQHLRPGNHRDIAPARFRDLGVVTLNGGRHDDDVGVADVRRVVP
jgi:hypothetical protein